LKVSATVLLFVIVLQTKGIEGAVMMRALNL